MTLRYKTKWFVLMAGDLILQVLLLVLAFPYRLTHISGRDLLYGLMALSWILIMPHCKRAAVRLLFTAAYLATAYLLQSSSMASLFSLVLGFDAFLILGRREITIKPHTIAYAATVIFGLGLTVFCCSLCFGFGDLIDEPTLCIILTFFSFLLRFMMFPRRCMQFPARSLDIFLSVKRLLHLGVSLFGWGHWFVSLPLFAVDILAYSILAREEFSKTPDRSKNPIHPDHDNDNKEVSSTKNRIIVSGMSAAGKDTIVDELLSRRPDMAKVISVTSRKPRPSEVEGVDYYFRTEREFMQMIEKNQLLEHAVYVGNYYGTPVDTPEANDIVYVVEPQGAKTLKQIFSDEAVSILIVAHRDVVEKRLRSRDKHATEAEIQARMQTALDILSCANEYDYIIVNDSSIADAASEIESILDTLPYRTQAQEDTIRKIADSFQR